MSEEIILSGEWFIKDTEENLKGVLHINESENQIYLILTKLCTPEKPLLGIKASGVVPIIIGTIDTGGRILLYGCEFGGKHTQMFQRTQVVVGVKYAFWNLDIDDESKLLFSKVSIDFGEILEWANLCSFESDFGSKFDQFKWNHSDRMTIEINENTSLLIYPVFGRHSISLKEKEIKMSQKIEFQLCYQEPKNWKSILDDIKILKNILTLGMLRSIYIDSMEYYHESHKIEEMSGIIRPMKIFCGIGTPGKHKPGNSWDYLFTLKDLTDNQNRCFHNWFDKYQKLKPVIDLSTVAFHYTDISAEMLFLNLAQGLETYHARFVSNKPKQYFVLVDDFLKEKYGVDNKEEYSARALKDRAFMISEQNEERASSIHLKSRLGYLFYMKDQVWTEFLGYSREDFVQKMVDSRNYYTHYSENKEDKIFTEDQIIYVNGILMDFLDYYILKEIGIDESQNQKLFREKMITINQNYKQNISTGHGHNL